MTVPRTSVNKEWGSYRSGPGALRINFGLLAVPSVHVAYALALVGVAKLLPAPLLALLLHRRERWGATLHRVGCRS
jgi:hypothetical protein